MDKYFENILKKLSLEKVMNKAIAPLQDDKKIKRVEIIVLKYKSPEMEKDCINRIIEYTQWPYKLNIFDNRGNGPNTSKIWNKLIKESTCDYVLFIDSDAFVQPTRAQDTDTDSKKCWLTEMMKPFTMWKNIAIIGPVCGTNAVSTMQSMDPSGSEPFEIDGHISGYCFLTYKSIYEKYGMFDEDFCFYGQESDWIEKIMERKEDRIVIVPRAHVIHGYDSKGSVAGKKAEKDGELNIDEDSSYSYIMWNLKKKIRLNKQRKDYKFDGDPTV